MCGTPKHAALTMLCRQNQIEDAPQEASRTPNLRPLGIVVDYGNIAGSTKVTSAARTITSQVFDLRK